MLIAGALLKRREVGTAQLRLRFCFEAVLASIAMVS